MNVNKIESNSNLTIVAINITIVMSDSIEMMRIKREYIVLYSIKDISYILYILVFQD